MIYRLLYKTLFEQELDASKPLRKTPQLDHGRHPHAIRSTAKICGPQTRYGVGSQQSG